MVRQIALVSLLIGLLCNCRSKPEAVAKKDTLFELLPAEQTGVHFANTLTESQNLNILTFEYFYNGGGVGVGDINNDGLTDLFFSGNMVPSRLYLNKGGKGKEAFKFEDITESAGIHTRPGWATGVAMVDINGDGLLDIYVCRAGPHEPEKRANQLYINQGNATFKEQASEYGLADTGHTTQAAFFDYDRDGDLDVYLVTNVLGQIGPNVIRPKISDGSSSSTDRLYRNEGNGTNGHPTFANVSQQAGIHLEGYGLGISVVDINQDGWPDVYVSNDYLSNDILYINQRDGTFKDEIAKYFKHQSYSAMGNDAADVDNDGLRDFFTVDMLPEDNVRRKCMFGSMNYDRYLSELQYAYQPQFVRNTLQHNNGSIPALAGQPIFSEIGRFSGVHSTDWSWSCLLADYDNDGYRDLMVTNGYPKDITNRDFALYRKALHEQTGLLGNDYLQRGIEALKEVIGANVPNYLFHNNGDLTFTDQSADWGFDLPSYSNGAAYADFDNDGDLDLVINNINAEAFIYRNCSNERSTNHFLRVNLQGDKGNPYGFGTKIELFYKGRKQGMEHSPYRGYQSTVENTLHFGLGAVANVDSMYITWLDGKRQRLDNVKANQVLTISQRNAQPYQQPKSNLVEPIFKEVSEEMAIQYKHTEDTYIDFKVQPLLFHLISQEGPGVAVGDMNGDNLEDFFVGGAFNHSGLLFFQQAHGKFKSLPLCKETKYEEDLGSLLFDADGDNDLDLYVVSGSSEFAPGSKYYQDRLYKNDSKGTFALAPDALPTMLSSGSSVNAADFDHDGDLDLFVGGRLSPTQYPLPTKSYVLRNDGGRFTDATDEVCGEMNTLGMVTASLWTDFDQDGWTDLMVVGEWMPITFFKNKQGKLVNVSTSTGLTHTHGWWNSLVAGDFDSDGDIDYAAGNLGLNNEWRTSPQKPICLYAADFDQNGSLDPVLCQYLGDVLSPVHPRDEMINQMNGLRKKFPRYADYAKAKLSDVFSETQLNQAYLLKSETFESAYLENKGNGRFTLRPLPSQAQLAPVFGMLSGDYDEDGKLDLLLTGNSYATEAITGSYDASIGLFLKGNGKGDFTPLPARESGFFVDGDAKSLAELTLRGKGRLLIATCNNNTTKAFVRQKSSQATSIQAQPMDARAEITYLDGHKARHEFYYGSGYLSQSSRTLWLPETVSKVAIVDFSGKSRHIKFHKPYAMK